MVVNYNKIYKKFSESRKNMKWEEISYFFDFINKHHKTTQSVLDVGCGNGRLLGELIDGGLVSDVHHYLGIDFSNGLLEEAKKSYPEYHFKQGDMRDEKVYGNHNYDLIFLIASFHHLENEADRLAVLENCSSILKDGGYIFMTNWALDSELNKVKYNHCKISHSQNTYGNYNYNIKFGDHMRFYHGFNIEELENLFGKTQLTIIENRLFDSERNFISILQK